ncbi:MAG TPA: calcium-binding protein [Tepidisphaeraceae bacterium]|nr:calcium-binding protein [Tepidisphaeraceae bacterium]
MSGKTLEVDGDPQFQNYIDVEYTDSSKTTISVSIGILPPGQQMPFRDPSDIFTDFPAKGVKLVWVRGGEADDQIGVGCNATDANGQYIGFDITTRVDALDGNNRVFAPNQNITVNCGSGNDTVAVGNGNDILRGGAGDDLLGAGDGRDEISGGAGNDWIIGGMGRETITGGAGNDRIGVQDLAHGGDLIYCGAGDDSVTCGNGNDTIWGGAGNDTMTACYGNVVFGIGIGTDTAISYNKATFYTPNISLDRTSYAAGVDKIVKAVSKNETNAPVI